MRLSTAARARYLYDIRVGPSPRVESASEVQKLQAKVEHQDLSGLSGGSGSVSGSGTSTLLTQDSNLNFTHARIKPLKINP